jgi:hypothetical protein
MIIFAIEKQNIEVYQSIKTASLGGMSRVVQSGFAAL